MSGLNENLAARGVSPRSTAARIGVLGDSIAGEQSSNIPTALSTGTNGSVPWACALSGGRMNHQPVDNFGVGGERADQILLRTPAAVAAMAARGVRFCYISAGTNDVAAKRAPVLVLADIKAIALMVRDAGIVPLLSVIMPRSYSAMAVGDRPGAKAAQSFINSQLRSWVAIVPGVALIDPVALVTDPANADGEPLGAAATPTSLFRDLLHPATRGGFLIGKRCILPAVLPYLRDVVPFAQTVIDVYDAALNPNGNKLTNGVMAGNAGPKGTGATGVFADGWTASRYSGSAAVVDGTKIADAVGADGAAGTVWQRCVITCTAGASTESIRIRQTVTGKFVAGERVKGVIRVRVNDASGLLGVSPAFVQVNAVPANTNQSTGMLRHAIANIGYLYPATAIDELVIEAPEQEILADTVTIQFDIQIVVAGASANCSVDVANVEFSAA